MKQKEIDIYIDNISTLPEMGNLSFPQMKNEFCKLSPSFTLPSTRKYKVDTNWGIQFFHLK